MHSDTELYNQLTWTINEINGQIDQLKAELREDNEKRPEFAHTIYERRFTNGHPVLLDLITAKANALAAMANLKASQRKGGK